MKRLFFRGIILTTLSAFTITGCAGRTANPVSEFQYGDDKKTCDHVKAELSQINNEITVKRQTQDGINASNTILFVGGLFFIWPLWFAMNVKNADGIEADALQRRHNALLRYAADKNCGIEIQQIKTEEPKPAPKEELTTGM